MKHYIAAAERKKSRMKIIKGMVLAGILAAAAGAAAVLIKKVSPFSC